MGLAQKEMVDELKVQWRKLWQERIDDKLRAEGIAADDYFKLFVEKGTVIHATRDFRTLNFKDILEQHQIANADRFIPPCPQVGGWTKFIKTQMANQKRQGNRRVSHYREEQRECQQPKKGGRGWLHI